MTATNSLVCQAVITSPKTTRHEQAICSFNSFRTASRTTGILWRNGGLEYLSPVLKRLANLLQACVPLHIFTRHLHICGMEDWSVLQAISCRHACPHTCAHVCMSYSSAHMNETCTHMNETCQDWSLLQPISCGDGVATVSRID